MLTPQKKVFTYLGICSGFILTVATSTLAEPVQCYIGKGGTYQVCDLRTVEPQKYLLIWPDGDKTAIIETNVPDISVFRWQRIPRLSNGKSSWLKTSM